MGQIRAFRTDDIGEVADLWQKVFRRVDTPAPESLRSYFEEVFFRNPWQDAGLPSLVYEQGSRLIGFLGVVPRRMTFRGQPIRVAVATQFMMDPERPSGLAAFDLMKSLFAGPQDLCFTDGAHQLSQQIWKRLGGDVAMLHSLDWIRIFRPALYAMDSLVKIGLPAIINQALRPVCGGLDAVAGRREPFRLLVPAGLTEEATEERLLGGLSQWAGNHALQPATDESLGWLLRQAAEKKRHGILRSRMVRNAGGESVGWFLYYSSSRGTATVLQVRARRHAIALVLSHLFHDARKRGAMAISGQVQPQLLGELATNRCIIRCHGLGVLVQSRNAELLAAIHRGDALLSRLDGEWWLRFSDYRLGLEA